MNQKKQWSCPQLTVHGTVERLTQRFITNSKQFGYSDGFTFQGSAITWGS